MFGKVPTMGVQALNLDSDILDGVDYIDDLEKILGHEKAP